MGINYKNYISKILKEKRGGKTQEQFSEEVDIEISLYKKLESCNFNNIELKTVKKIGDAIKVPYEIFFGFTEYIYYKRDLEKNIGENLLKLRKLQKKTQKHFSKDLKISLSTYKKYESQVGNPKVSTLIKIATYLNLSIIKLFQ